MFKKRDILIFSLIAILTGFFVVRQYYATREASKLIQPENSQVLAMEVAYLTKDNANLRQEVADLENRSNSYQKSVNDQTSSNDNIIQELNRYLEVNGQKETTGRGIILEIKKPLNQAQVVDLANTIRNIGVNGFSINNKRVGINYFFSNIDQTPIEIKIISNPTIIKSALTRKGGFLDQLFPTGAEYSITEKDGILLGKYQELKFIYSKNPN